MYKYLILMPVLLLACSNPSPGEKVVDLYPEETTIVLQEWSKVYGDAPNLKDIVVIFPKTEEEYGKYCNTENTSKGCYSLDSSAIVIRKSWSHQDRNTVTHELMHILGLRTFGPGGGDAGHHDPVIWSRSGILEKANSSLGLPGDLED